MSNTQSWLYAPISSFLTYREGKYNPNAKEVCDLQRLSKIDFSGQIHVSDKPSKTDMIIVMPNDLVISGINVAKGAIAVYQGDKPITATIHYSSYTFDETKIDIEYFKRFLQSPSFLTIMQAQVKGGIKTEIKPKQFLPLMIHLPELTIQKEIALYLQSLEKMLLDLNDALNQQGTYITKLRESILKDAIEGKLTAQWREENPVVIGDPNTDANVLLEEIQTEKKRLIAEGKLKKEKPLAPISDAEKPFELPEGWVWARLRDITHYSEAGKSFLCTERPIKSNEWGVVKVSSVSWGEFLENENKFYSKIPPQDTRFQIRQGDFLISRANGSVELVGRSVIVNTLDKNLLLSDKIIRFVFPETSDQMLKRFVNMFNQSLQSRSHFTRGSTGSSTTMKNITRDTMNELPIPLPTIAEQEIIVDKVQSLLAQIDALEAELKKRQVQVDQLTQAVLTEAFTPNL